jgi:N,N'-diacetyllegionaminate synthase
MKYKKKILIIAEAGINHNGSLKRAKQLIKAAKKSNADYVKFQIFKAENVVTKNAGKSAYQKKSLKDKETQYQMIKKFELPYEGFKILKKECKKNKIKFLCSPFDIDSFYYLKKLKQKIIKIPSGEITNYPLIAKIGAMNVKVIMSTGMSNFKEIANAINLLTQNGTKKKNISLLHCNTAYPTPFIDVNLPIIKKLKNKFNVTVGYSDHTLGIEVAIAAVCLGAELIEKHITLDKNLNGPDHKSSLNPSEFASMVKCIRNVEKTIIQSKKLTKPSERGNIKVVRKSLTANLNISKNEIFTEKNLTTKRPGTGISPMQWQNIIGKKAKKNYVKDDLIK